MSTTIKIYELKVRKFHSESLREIWSVDNSVSTYILTLFLQKYFFNSHRSLQWKAIIVVQFSHYIVMKPSNSHTIYWKLSMTLKTSLLSQKAVILSTYTSRIFFRIIHIFIQLCNIRRIFCKLTIILWVILKLAMFYQRWPGNRLWNAEITIGGCGCEGVDTCTGAEAA